MEIGPAGRGLFPSLPLRFFCFLAVAEIQFRQSLSPRRFRRFAMRSPGAPVARLPSSSARRRGATPPRSSNASKTYQAFETNPLCPKGLLEPGDSRPRAAAGVLVDAVSPGRSGTRLRTGYAHSASPARTIRIRSSYVRHLRSRGFGSRRPAWRHVNCGRPIALDQLAEKDWRTAITLRINPASGTGTTRRPTPAASKRGIWHEQLPDAAAGRPARTYRGRLPCAYWPGADLEHLAEVCGAVEKLALQIGDNLTTISGGGLPVPYHKARNTSTGALPSVWNDSRERLQQALGRTLHLELEPGRLPGGRSAT